MQLNGTRISVDLTNGTFRFIRNSADNILKNG